MFDEKTKQELKYYVYMLVDPTNKSPFYIGKGVDDRVFNHLNCAVKDVEEQNLKYDKIREIQNGGLVVNHVIVRHGLVEKEAFQIESSLIDSFKYCDLLLTNKVNGHNSIEKGLMTSEEVTRLYNAPPLNEISNDCVLININRKYRRGTSEQSIYQATKEVWTIRKSKLHTINYVLSEYRGYIVEVFKVEEWYEKERGYTPKSKKYGETKIGYGFNGKVADIEIRDKYINKSIAHIKKRGAASVIRYNL